ncbi:MAG: 4Fe-4S dicluster domain-containing protein [Nitrospinae bacterium]|nr:4Fe-4S dicluster domain-containing protein [Nitrospinota bacterium]
MVIDLDKCNGCGACTIACQAENNIAVVGEKMAREKRTMSWLRVERYFEGEWPELRVVFLPMPCQQCGKAPCEPVCPVFATYHNPDGLNAMVYNRCMGVRFCANNCPYGVRKFNWFNSKWEAPLEQQLNPDVSIREVGVMEKCTFCMQRIRRGKDKAKDEGRGVKDGEVVSACAQSCPTKAITFGYLDDPESKVAELSKSKRRHRLLEEHGLDPSVIYLKGGA